MAYIIFVKPSILADAGIPKEAAIAATVWSAVIGSAAMGLWANFPVAVAPGMGLNAFFEMCIRDRIKVKRNLERSARKRRRAEATDCLPEPYPKQRKNFSSVWPATRIR